MSKKDFEDCIAEVIEAVNTARAGAIIGDSKQRVRVATAKLRQKVFERAS
ncbi:MAG: hypothetical protein JSU94_10080 [Phycisphaerales bacterium]|nr:MAG: hypothetical protein JSU94_10080 [Phycisphaerales bacterium]